MAMQSTEELSELAGVEIVTGKTQLVRRLGRALTKGKTAPSEELLADLGKLKTRSLAELLGFVAGK